MRFSKAFKAREHAIVIAGGIGTFWVCGSGYIGAGLAVAVVILIYALEWRNRNHKTLTGSED